MLALQLLFAATMLILMASAQQCSCPCPPSTTRTTSTFVTSTATALSTAYPTRPAGWTYSPAPGTYQILNNGTRTAIDLYAGDEVYGWPVDQGIENRLQQWQISTNAQGRNVIQNVESPLAITYKYCKSKPPYPSCKLLVQGADGEMF